MSFFTYFLFTDFGLQSVSGVSIAYTIKIKNSTASGAVTKINSNLISLASTVAASGFPGVSFQSSIAVSSAPTINPTFAPGL